MAALTLSRGQFQLELNKSGAASGANTYTLDAYSNGLLIKVEANGAAGTVVLKVRWQSSDSLALTAVQTLTFTCVADTTGISTSPVTGYNHTTFPSSLSGCTGVAVIESGVFHKFSIDIVSFTTVTAATVWVAGK